MVAVVESAQRVHSDETYLAARRAAFSTLEKLTTAIDAEDFSPDFANKYDATKREIANLARDLEVVIAGHSEATRYRQPTFTETQVRELETAKTALNLFWEISNAKSELYGMGREISNTGDALIQVSFNQLVKPVLTKLKDSALNPSVILSY